MSVGSFASLTAGLLVRKPSSIITPETFIFALVRKGAAEPSAVMPPDTFPLAQPVVPGPVHARVHARRPRQNKRRRLPAVCRDSDLPAMPRRTFVLSADEYKALDSVAVKRGTTPQGLLRKALNELIHN